MFALMHHEELIGAFNHDDREAPGRDRFSGHLIPIYVFVKRIGKAKLQA
jgi:hypothetical protein